MPHDAEFLQLIGGPGFSPAMTLWRFGFSR